MSKIRVLSFVLALASAAIAPGQVVTAKFFGTVTDPNSAVVPGATVTVQNVGRGTSIARQSDDSGEVVIAALPVGDYLITVEAPGFKTLKRSGVSLSAGEDVRLTLPLEIGQVAESVEVTADTPLINTANAEQRTTIEQVRVKELPILRRDWTQLLNLSTGVQLSGGSVRLNGLAPSSFRLTVDGTDATQDNELPSFSMSGNFNFIKGVATEAIAEVNLTKGIQSAEIANTMSGNVNIITKSGSNQFHGSAFWLNNIEDLNARNQFLQNKPGLVYNQYGGSVGGPVVRNKAFFFGAYEGYRQRGFASLNEQVPTAEFRVRIQSVTKIYDKLFSVFPLPTRSYAAGANTGAWVGSGTEQGSDDHLVVRGDYNFTSTTLLNARYTRSRPFRETPRVVEANNRTWKGTVEQGTANVTHVRPSWSFETRFGFNYNMVPRVDNYFGLYASDPSYNGIGGLGFGISAETLKREGYTWSIEESISRSIGKHSLKFGGIYYVPHVRRTNVEVPSITFSSIQDMLDNVPNAGQVTIGTKEYDLRTMTLGFFIQDDFRVNRRLIVNMGMRWDYFGVPKERDNRLFNRNGPFGTGSYRNGDEIWDPDYNNFSPRIGFAYTIGKDNKTVLRGGGGMFHSPLPLYAGGVDIVRDDLNQPFRVTFSRTEALASGAVFRWPISNDSVAAYVRGRTTLIGDTAVDTNNPSPFSYQWNLGIQREFWRGLVLDTAYVGTRGVHIQMVRKWNQVDRITGQRPYSGFSEFRYRDATDSSAFHSWQTSLRKRFSSGLSAGANYTWASAFSYTNQSDLQLPNSVQDIYNVRADKGLPDGFIRHNFISDVVYELPFARLAGSGNLLMRNLLAGWQVSGIFTAQSGAPVNITQETAFENSRADYVGGSAEQSNYRDTLLYLTRTPFAPVPISSVSGAPIRPGNIGRNALRNIGLWNLDASITKRFFLSERIQGKMEAQSLNALNHTNLSGLESRINRANFGQFTSTRGARVVQLNLRVEF
ncbi:MAG: TonB-dependent receptor [Bryobacteraceae bacterium]|nr:TonB-dependent receptor [Bryobacteraceae bacterium]